MAFKAIAVKKYVIRLSKDERARLKELIGKGKSPAKRRQKARILLKADVLRNGEGWSDSKIIEGLSTSVSMVYRVRQQLVEEGLEAVLGRKPPDDALAGTEALDAWLDRSVMTGHHVSSTCRMGRADERPGQTVRQGASCGGRRGSARRVARCPARLCRRERRGATMPRPHRDEPRSHALPGAPRRRACASPRASSRPAARWLNAVCSGHIVTERM